MGEEHHRASGEGSEPEAGIPVPAGLTDDEYQSLLYAEAEAHKRFMRACAYFPDATSMEEVIALASEVVALNNALDAAGTTVQTIETVEVIQGGKE